jgi:hypothetical protein
MFNLATTNGRLKMWSMSEALAQWLSPRCTTPGSHPRDLAIETTLILDNAFAPGRRL